MKKIYSFAMLFAAAATAFSSCAKEEALVSNETVTLNIRASVTKTVFGDKESGAYPTKWTENKQVCFSANDTKTAVKVPPVLSDGGASATFSTTFTSLASSGTIYAFSPVGDYNNGVPGFTNFTTYGFDDAIYLSIPAEQTPLANSVEECAQAIAASQTYSSTSGVIDMTFHHLVAYGKMAITNFAGDNIKTVKLQFPEDVCGKSIKYVYKTGVFAEGINEKKITLNADNVVDNIFWFALAPTEGNTGEMKIIVTDALGDTYTKSLNLTSKALPFVKGEVSSFTANFSGISKDVVLHTRYDRITKMDDLESSDYVIVGEQTTSSFGFLTAGSFTSSRLEYTKTYSSAEALPSSIEDPDDANVWTLDVDETGVTLYSQSEEKYLKADSGLSFNDTEGTKFTASCSSDMFEFKVSTTYLGVNKGSAWWRDYATSTLTTTKGLVLYKKYDSRISLATPVATVSENVISWESVPNAGSYTVKIDGKAKEGITGTSYTFDNADFSLEVGYYTVGVIAVPSDVTSYKDSDEGEATGKVKVGTPKLATPDLKKGTVSAESITVTWDEIDGATNGYYCSISPADASAQDVTEGTVTFTGLTESTEYTITVYAKATTGVEALAKSDDATIVVSTSASGGKIYEIDGTLASWTFSSGTAGTNYPSNKTNFANNGSNDLASGAFYLNGTGSTWNTNKGYAFTAVTDITITVTANKPLKQGAKIKFSMDTFYNKAKNAPMTGFDLTATEGSATASTTGLSVTSFSLGTSSASKVVVYTLQNDVDKDGTVKLVLTGTGKAGSGEGYISNIKAEYSAD